MSFRHHVLRKSSGLDDISWMSWKLALCLIGSWTLVYLSIIKGVSSLGKVWFLNNLLLGLKFYQNIYQMIGRIFHSHFSLYCTDSSIDCSTQY